MVPVLFGSSVAQINILFDTLIASFLVTGSISWLYYSDRLVEFPLGVFGIALATVILPSLSDHHANESSGDFSATLDWALRLVVLIALPAAIGLTMLAEPVLATIFHGGAFTTEDVDMAGASLRAFAPGLMGFVLVKVLSPGYFARQDTRTPERYLRCDVAANGMGARACRACCRDECVCPVQCNLVVRGFAQVRRLSRRRRLAQAVRAGCAGLRCDGCVRLLHANQNWGLAAAEHLAADCRAQRQCRGCCDCVSGGLSGLRDSSP
jgi:hypothetical protein